MNFVYDGSFDGLLSALIKAVYSNNSTVSKDELLIDENISVKSDRNTASEFEKDLYDDLLILYLSETERLEEKALDYFKKIKKNGMRYRNNIADSSIKSVFEIKKRFFSELERLNGFVRFYEIDKNLMFSKVSPDSNIISFLGRHFMKKMKENFIIFDEKRNIAFFRYGNRSIIKNIKELKFRPSKEEEKINMLWKKYFNDIAIKERVNPKLQKNLVPLKYRKNMIEF
jgi:probable DNA metabolism protein